MDNNLVESLNQLTKNMETVVSQLNSAIDNKFKQMSNEDLEKYIKEVEKLGLDKNTLDITKEINNLKTQFNIK